jgi:hypothetical protein
MMLRDDEEMRDEDEDENYETMTLVVMRMMRRGVERENRPEPW